MNQLPVEAQVLRVKGTASMSRPYVAVKRVLDVCGSLSLLLVMLPLFILVILAIELESPGPVFFSQQRLGRGGKRFGLYKFRTMRRAPTRKDLIGAHMALNGHDEDITRVGAVLRATGLNELPQLMNILKGEMSFIGPRPAVLFHEQYYTEWHRKRLGVAPGVTGLAQVCGRNLIPWGWRVALDRCYVEHMSFALDWAIFWKTFYVVLRGIGTEGSYELYFDFTPPEEGVLDKLERQGVFRCFLRADAPLSDKQAGS
jgi:lipopolysaccharide/colanic/teichoic acid biosynthesis glycosyltransferase